MTIELKPCPICGKQPKIIYETSGFGAWCIIQCKPFLCKPHLKHEEGKSIWNRALVHAIEGWNRRVDDAKAD